MNTESVTTIGSALGILIGFVAGIVFLVILKSARRVSFKDRKAILAYTGQLLVLPTFCVGGPWVTGKLLTYVMSQADDGGGFVQSYLISPT